MSERGKYIVIEGGDGTGKSTQAGRLYHHLAYSGLSMCGFMVEEPDGAYEITRLESLLCAKWSDEQKHSRGLVPEATAIRKRLKDVSHNLSTDENIQLFTQARKLNWDQAIKPALDAGETVVTARNWLSTLAYQGYAEGGDTNYIESLTRETLGDEYMNPDIELILISNDERARQERLASRGTDKNLDAFESRDDDFQIRMQLGYKAVASSRNIDTLIVPSGNSIDLVEKSIWKHVTHFLR